MTGRGPLAAIDAAVVDADERQSLVAVRSLGRAGIRVGAFDVVRQPPAAHSRWCAVSGRVPDAADQQAYLAALLELVARRRPRVLLPARDGTIEALRAGRDQLEAEVSLALASEAALELAVDKEQTLALAERLGIAIPVTVSVADPAQAAAALDRTGLPAVLKPVRSWVASDGGGNRLGPVVVTDAAEASLAGRSAARAGASVIVQQWLPGAREAISLMCAEGKVHARFAQVARRMLPPLGGSSILRESIPLPPDLTAAAEALVSAAGLDGYSEIEFRRDAEGRPFLMEINPRLSASVEIAVRAGVDFPLLLYSWAAGLPLAFVSSYRTGLSMRWLGGDLKWLGRTLRERGRPDVPPPTAALRSFARDSLLPHAYDYVDLRDPVPALVATGRFLLAEPRRRYARSRKRRASEART